jgi:hypothetical protein
MTVRICCNPSCTSRFREITACNGFCLSSDWLLAFEGKIPWNAVRELCCLCAFRFEPIRDIINLLRSRANASV